ATTSSAAMRLSVMRSFVERGVALVDECLTGLVGHTTEVQLEGEALLEPVAALHVDGVDAVERLLGPADDGRALGRDVSRYLARCSAQVVMCDHAQHGTELVQLSR